MTEELQVTQDELPEVKRFLEKLRASKSVQNAGGKLMLTQTTRLRRLELARSQLAQIMTCLNVAFEALEPLIEEITGPKKWENV